MFPIHDSRGQVIGFGGRVLGNGEPKYLNSPETPVFSKGRELYGLYLARNAIRAVERVVVVEGYMVGLLADDGPRHHLQQGSRGRIRIVSGAQKGHEFIEGQPGRQAFLVGRQVRRRDEWPEHSSAGQVLIFVHLLGLPLEWVAAGRVGRVGMAIVAAARTDDIAAQPHQSAVLAREMQRHRIDRVALLDLALVCAG